jgi:hypothetical protein
VGQLFRERDMEKKSLTSAAYMQSLLLIHIAMLMGIVIFVGVAVYNRATGGIPATPLSSAMPMLFMVLAVSVVCLPLSFFVYRRFLAQAADKPTFEGKLRAFQIACLLRGALLEAPALMATAALLLTGVYGFLAVPLIAAVLMATSIPTVPKIVDALQLGSDEVRKLNDPAFVLGEYVPADVS